jgi:hypothetical protein
MFLFSVQEDATSPVIGVVLNLAILFILALLVLLLFQMPNITWQEPGVPEIFKITNIIHDTNFDSSMIVKNAGTVGYKNKNIYAKTYRNGVELDCIIPTLNGNKFISSHHFGIQYIAGMSGQTWYSDASIRIDYADRTFHPGDLVTFEVFDNTTKRIISRSAYRA